jgi:hypothetical protein
VNEDHRPRPLQTIDTPLGLFELLEGGVIFWTVSLGTVLNAQTAEEAYASVNALASGDPVAIFGDARGLGFADYRARRMLAESEIDGRVATGIVVSNRVIRFLANQYARQVGRTRPVRVFDVPAEAIEWGAEKVRMAVET